MPWSHLFNFPTSNAATSYTTYTHIMECCLDTDISLRFYHFGHIPKWVVGIKLYGVCYRPTSANVGGIDTSTHSKITIGEDYEVETW